jgi:CO/xanthine dehydrogenase FAD-binding subunit
MRARSAEKSLRGVPASDETARAAAQRAARDDANPTDNPHAGSAYRQHLVEVLTLRALRSAFRQGAR